MASNGQASNIGMRLLTRCCPNVEEYYQRIIKEGSEVLQTFGRSSDGQPSVEAEKIRGIVHQVMRPVSGLRAAGIVGTLGAYMISKYIPLFSSLFYVGAIASAFFSYECHRIHDEFRTLDRWLIERLDTNVSWNDFFPKVKGCFYQIQGSTLFFSRSKLFGKEIEIFPAFLKSVKSGTSGSSLTPLSQGHLMRVINMTRRCSQSINK